MTDTRNEDDQGKTEYNEIDAILEENEKRMDDIIAPIIDAANEVMKRINK